jgi:type I restriction enzyme M protein
MKNDVLINSTGDGTIGRVAVYNQEFPAVVDGHITIVRFKDKDLAWYSAAYLLSEQGQDQIYRYINGSSGQVEIYPQDIARLWIPPRPRDQMKQIGNKLRSACEKHNSFFSDMKAALRML